jgi:hypothetical protein
MTFPEVLWFFDSVEFDQPYYPDQPGMVKCCGLPVVMRGGGARVECSRCGRAVSVVGRQWMLTENGARGIPIRTNLTGLKSKQQCGTRDGVFPIPQKALL